MSLLLALQWVTLAAIAASIGFAWLNLRNAIYWRRRIDDLGRRVHALEVGRGST